MEDKKELPVSVDQLRKAQKILKKYKNPNFRALLGQATDEEKPIISQVLEDLKDKDKKNSYWEWVGAIEDDNSEIVNDKSLDAIKDNFTPPGAKGKMWKVGLYNTVGDKSDFKKFVREGDDIDDIVKQLREENPEYAKGGYDTQRAEEGEDLDEWLKLPGWHKGVKDKIDANDNGEIEVDEMADFQKSLDDYAAKNKKGRDDIPATYKR